uniref:Hrp65 isoform x2 n=1 Tax=Triatoma infestans TaxID=30076 RepID=A0A161MBR5_TRIIF
MSTEQQPKEEPNAATNGQSNESQNRTPDGNRRNNQFQGGRGGKFNNPANRKMDGKIKMEGDDSNQQHNMHQQHGGHNMQHHMEGGGGGASGGGRGRGRGMRGGRGGGGDMGRNTNNSSEGGDNDQQQQHMMGGGGGGGGRGRGRGRGGHMRGGPSEASGGGPGRMNEMAYLNERLLKTVSGPTLDLPPQEFKEKKFNGRCRLYIGNLDPSITEEEFKALFVNYGETSELYINKEKNFAFIRLDYRSTAEKAKRELDGHVLKNRNLRVRFAPLGATVKVKNLTPYVTNELLELAFSVFGEVERAMVSVDERGNSLKEGIVEFTRKGSAQSALRYCNEGCFFLTSSLKPVILEPYEAVEDSDGFSEKMILKKGPDFFEARETGPRFANKDSFEHEFGTRWKQIYELFRQKEEALKREMRLEEEKLEAQLQYAKYEHETEVLREQLRQRELDRERQKREWEIKERQAEEQRVAEEEALRRQQEELSRRMHHQDDELRRRQQENSLFMQTHQMNSLVGDQDPSRQGGAGGYGGSSTNNDPLREYDNMEAGVQRQTSEANYMEMGYNRSSNRYDGRGDPGRMEDMASRRPPQNTGSAVGGGGGRWGHQERRSQNEDFPNKRRRY